MTLKRVGLVWRILGLVGAVWLVMALVQAFVQVQLLRVSRDVADQQRMLDQQAVVQDLATDVREMEIHALALALTLLNEHEQSATAARDRALKRLEEVRAFDAQLASDVGERVGPYFEAMFSAADAYSDENRVLGNSLATQAGRAAIEMDQFLAQAHESTQAAATAAGANVANISATTRSLAIAGLAIATLVGAGLAWGMSRRITGRIRKSALVLESVAKGDLGAHADVDQDDEIGRMNASMNRTVLVLTDLLAENRRLIEACSEGRLNERAASERFEGAYREVCSGINAMLDGIARPIQETSRVLERVARGDLHAKIECDLRGQWRKLGDDLASTKEVLGAVIAEVRRLTEAARAGQLSERIEAARFEGVYRDLCSGVNAMLDGVVVPLRGTSEILQGVARGQLPDHVSVEFEGEYRKMLESVAATVTVLQKLMSETGTLIEAAKEGRLDQRGRAELFEGAYRDLALGINDMLDSVVAPLSESSAVLQKIARGDLSAQVDGSYKGGHDKLKSSVNATADVLKRVLAEINECIDAAGAGRLDRRVAHDGLDGAWLELCMGINQMLDSLLSPVSEALVTLQRVAQRDLGAEIAGHYEGDHAKLADSVNSAVAGMRAAIAAISSNARTLSTSSSELGKIGERLSGAAQESADEAQRASASTDKVNGRMQSIASASEEMTTSIREISSNATAVVQMGLKAVDAIGVTRSSVEKLRTSSDQIGQVVKLIQTIAQQTNLLALNATIEAARAGESGKGFAVVASEVKGLANQTSQATQQVAQTISTIQVNIQSMVEAVDSVGQMIEKIHEHQSSVTAAIEEQTATTLEIGRSVTDAAAGAGEISSGMSVVANAAGRASSAAVETIEAGRRLSRLAGELETLVGQFQGFQRAGAP